ncbi:MAG: hypothetical protein MJ239_03510 [Bacilli bacterium]|nr:hypothetical protein [Bacilli bacterium]
MKKKNALILALASISLLASCGNQTPSAPISSGEESIVPSEPTSVSTEKKKSKWGGEVGETIIDSFGWDIPFIANDGVEFESGKDAFKDPYMFMFVEFEGYKENPELINEKMAEYANICVKRGYTVTYETISYMDENFVIYQYPVYFADIEMSEDVGFELQIVEGARNGKELMGIYAMTYPLYDENKWPTNMVSKVIGTDVPKPEGDDQYTYFSQLGTFEDDGSPYCYIYAYGMYEEDLDAYVEHLRASSWLVDQEEDEYGMPYYRACDKNYKYMMYFGYDYDDYVGSYFYVYKYPKFR